MYRVVYTVFLRHLPPETAHVIGFWLIRAAAGVPGVARLGRRFLAPRDPVLRTRALGLDFSGPLGLAAGFDKDGHGAAALTALGFGFVEVGTVTARAAARQPQAADVPVPGRSRPGQPHGLQQLRRGGAGGATAGRARPRAAPGAAPGR